jgi:hypothetical protein
LPQLLIDLSPPDPYRTDSYDLAAFGLHAARALAPPMLQHSALAAVVSASLGLRARGGVLGAVRSVFMAAPVLIPAWIAIESDTLLRLSNDWAAWFRLPASASADAAVSLALIAADVFASVMVTAFVGVFTPVALREQRDFVGSLERSWRLLRGARGKMAGLIVMQVSAAILLDFGQFALFGWLRVGANPWPGSIGDAVLMGLRDIVWGVVVAACYLELRRRYEGALPDQIAETVA